MMQLRKRLNISKLVKKRKLKRSAWILKENQGFVELRQKKNNKNFEKKQLLKLEGIQDDLVSSHSKNMSVNKIPIRDKYNLLFRVRDKDFASLFSNIEDLLIGMYHN